MPKFLVTGASGQFGRLALDHLLDTLNVAPDEIAVTTRSPEDLAPYAARGVDVRQADFNSEASLDAAFAGIERLLLVSTNALDDQGTRLRQQRAAVAAAARAGVQHIVYTSLPYAERSTIGFAPDHAGTEDAIKASGIAGWTILRNNWYHENLAMSAAPALASGKWFSASGEGRIAFIARSDLALAAATALASDFSGQRVLTLSGARAFSKPELAALFTEATGKPIAIVPASTEDLAKGMIGAGMPEVVARIFATFDEAQKNGFLDGDAQDFEALTGRTPKPLEDWIAANARSIGQAKPAAH